MCFFEANSVQRYDYLEKWKKLFLEIVSQARSRNIIFFIEGIYFSEFQIKPTSSVLQFIISPLRGFEPVVFHSMGDAHR